MTIKKIIGWAINNKTENAQNRIFIELASIVNKSKFFIEAIRHQRQDIVDWLKKSSHLYAGFAITTNIKNLPKDTYTMRCIQLENNTLQASQPSLYKIKVE